MKTSLTTLKFFADFICKELGIVYQEANYYQLETRLVEVAQLFGLGSPEDLLKVAQQRMPADMKLMLLDVATNNETLFFRDPGVFEAIEQSVLKDWVALKKLTPFRIWSAACSYGQEPYSLAMVMDKCSSQLSNGYQIVATDISERALKAAEAGLYTQLQAQRGLPASYLVKYFSKASGQQDTSYEWSIKPELKRFIRFQKLNLLDGFAALGQFDLILCRNVLIYQSVERKREIIKKLRAQLSATGFLVLGAAESLLGLSDDFDLVRYKNVSLYRPKQVLSKAS